MSLTPPLKVAVVTGGHAYDVPPFEHALRALNGIDFYVQSLDDFTFYPETAASYDVALFYTMHAFKPGDALPWYQSNLFSTLEALGRAEQGIVVLHHGLCAFPEWPLWSELVGIRDRSLDFYYAQSVTAQIAAAHPITDGMGGWTMEDETYTMADPRPEDGNEVLLTTDHPKSMRVLGWARHFRQSRVFCYQPGHGASAFANPQFRRVLERGIHWAGRRI